MSDASEREQFESAARLMFERDGVRITEFRYEKLADRSFSCGNSSNAPASERQHARNSAAFIDRIVASGRERHFVRRASM